MIKDMHLAQEVKIFDNSTPEMGISAESST
jgi:hypothetical protein